MKIVLDTSILVRANERATGLGRDLLISVVESEHTLLLSNEMLVELARVLRYPRLQRFYSLNEEMVFVCPLPAPLLRPGHARPPSECTDPRRE